MTASIGSPPKPPKVAALGKPPTRSDTINNLNRPETPPQQKPVQKAVQSQLNMRIDPDKHEEIKIAAIKAKKTMGEYLIDLHDQEIQRSGGG